MFVSKFPFIFLLVLFLVLRQSDNELSLKVSKVKRFSEGQSGIFVSFCTTSSSVQSHSSISLLFFFHAPFWPQNVLAQWGKTVVILVPFFCRSQKDYGVRSSIKVGGKGLQRCHCFGTRLCHVCRQCFHCKLDIWPVHCNVQHQPKTRTKLCSSFIVQGFRLNRKVSTVVFQCWVIWKAFPAPCAYLHHRNQFWNIHCIWLNENSIILHSDPLFQIRQLFTTGRQIKSINLHFHVVYPVVLLNHSPSPGRHTKRISSTCTFTKILPHRPPSSHLPVGTSRFSEYPWWLVQFFQPCLS